MGGCNVIGKFLSLSYRCSLPDITALTFGKWYSSYTVVINGGSTQLTCRLKNFQMNGIVLWIHGTQTSLLVMLQKKRMHLLILKRKTKVEDDWCERKEQSQVPNISLVWRESWVRLAITRYLLSDNWEKLAFETQMRYCTSINTSNSLHYTFYTYNTY